MHLHAVTIPYRNPVELPTFFCGYVGTMININIKTQRQYNYDTNNTLFYFLTFNIYFEFVFFMLPN